MRAWLRVGGDLADRRPWEAAALGTGEAPCSPAIPGRGAPVPEHQRARDATHAGGLEAQSHVAHPGEAWKVGDRRRTAGLVPLQ